MRQREPEPENEEVKQVRSVDAYFPSMERIDSTIKDKIAAIYEEYQTHEVTEREVEQALSQTHPSDFDYYCLLSDAAIPYMDDLGRLAQRKRLSYFGNNVCLFSPIYIANYCGNSCRYCGFRAQSDIQRAMLTPEEIEAEMAALAQSGIEDVLILTGESEKYSPVAYIRKACEIAKKYFKTIGLEVYPLNTEEYRMLHEAGADFVTIFQETYNKEHYSYYHPMGHKRSFSYRIDTQERALRAGIRGVGFGALFGLSNPIEDAFKLGLHAKYVQQNYPEAEIAISLPRIRPTHGADTDLAFQLVGDQKFFQILLAIRNFLPFASITLSTREEPALKNLAVRYAATKISASVDTSIGHRSQQSKDTGDEQFEIRDERSCQQVYEDLKRIGMSPVFTDYVNV